MALVVVFCFLLLTKFAQASTISPSCVANLTAELVCSSHGYCASERCVCEGFWTGVDCGLSYRAVLGQLWLAYLFTFLVFFSAVAGIALMQLVRSCLMDSSITYWKVIHGLLVMEGLDHVVILAVDPDEQLHLVPAWARSMWNGLAVYFIICIFLIIVMYWCDVYCRYVRDGPQYVVLRRAGLAIRALLVVSFVLELSLRIVWTFIGEHARTLLFIHSGFIVLITLAICVAVLTFGPSLNRRLRAFAARHNMPDFADRMRKVHMLTVGATILVTLTLAVVAVTLVLASVWLTDVVSPDYWVIQQSMYRSLQVVFCVWILFVLRQPPEADYRRGYSSV